jgi:hypothetical protein
MNKKILITLILIYTFNLLGIANAEKLYYTINNISSKTLSICNGFGTCSSSGTNSMDIQDGFFCMERSNILGHTVHYEAQVINPAEDVELIYSLYEDIGKNSYPAIKLTNAKLINDIKSPRGGKCPLIG